MRQGKIRWSVIVATTAALLWTIGWSRSSIEHLHRIPVDDWHHPMHADAAGYYVYLPGTFLTGMRSEGIPDRLRDECMENGIDTTGGWLRTKYTYVTALMQLPFYLVANALTPGPDQDGFSGAHMDLLMISGIAYWSAGLAILYFALRRWYGLGWVTALLLLLAGSFLSPVFYYAFRMPGYSHVYSFFLVCTAVAISLSLREKRTILRESAFAAACALIAVARPVDALIGIVLHIWLWMRKTDRSANIRLLIVQALMLLIAFAPQALYWYATTGSPLHYSYGNETFSNWAHPQIWLFLASPQNGLVPWGPIFVMLPLAAVVAVQGKVDLAMPSTLLLSAIIYLCASWHERTFGCSFGARPLAQYVPFLLIILAPLVRRIQASPLITRVAVLAVVVFMCRTFYFMALHYEVCYFGGDTDWSDYQRLLMSALK